MTNEVISDDFQSFSTKEMFSKPLNIQHIDTFQTLPDGVFLQQQLDKLAGDMQGEHALCHLLQDPQVVAVSGGEAVRSRHDATKDYKQNQSDAQPNNNLATEASRDPIISQHSPAFRSGSLHKDEDLDLMPMDSVRLSSTGRTI